jgi:hypothetical protein
VVALVHYSDIPITRETEKRLVTACQARSDGKVLLTAIKNVLVEYCIVNGCQPASDLPLHILQLLEAGLKRLEPPTRGRFQTLLTGLNRRIQRAQGIGHTLDITDHFKNDDIIGLANPGSASYAT